MTTVAIPQPVSSLHTKLAVLRGAFGSIAKGGINRGVGDGYAFVEASEVGRRFIEAASLVNLTMLPVAQEVADIRPTVSGKMITWTVKTIWAITDGDSGEEIRVESYGQGSDNADKGMPKAQTNSMKYAILLVLQKAGDDPEADGKTDQLESQETRAKAATAARKAGQADVTPIVAEQPPVAGAEQPPVPQPAEQAPVVEQPTIAMASEGMRKAIRAHARTKGFTDPSLKAYAVETIGKDSSLKWTAADGDKLMAELDNEVRVLAFLDGSTPA